MIKFLSRLAALGLAAGLVTPQAMAVTTGLDFAGGCPETSTTTLCDNGSNATVDNVAAILGVNASLVTLIAAVDDTTSSTVNGLTINGIGALTGDWSISNPLITHIAFKSNGYFILGEVATSGGTWDNADWDFTLVDCPASICTAGPRPYTATDFTNNGGNIANLSNVRAFSVVPVPAAVWLFGSGLLGLVGVARRKRA